MKSPASTASSPRRRRQLGGDAGATLRAQGEPLVWLVGGGLALATLMILGLLALVLYQGVSTFWPRPLVQVVRHDDSILLGEVTRVDTYEPAARGKENLTEEQRATAERDIAAADGWARRRLLRTGNFEISGEHFDWVSDYQIAAETRPEWALLIERMTWGRFYGFPDVFILEHPLEEKTRAAAAQLAGRLPADPSRQTWCRVGRQRQALAETAEDAPVDALLEVWTEPAAVWRKFQEHHPEVRGRWRQRRRLEKVDSGAISHRGEAARLALRNAQLAVETSEQSHGADSARTQAARQRLAGQQSETEATIAWAEAEFQRVREDINRINRENARYRLALRTADGREAEIALADIVRAYPANRTSRWQRAGIYLSRWAEFLLDDPREANMEGGVFPAIFGTVVMTVLMSLAVVPFGVLAALYLREYAKAGPMISAVRIAINNLAGVPSIVFGVFGLGFFCYLMGGSIDQLFFAAKLPSPTFGTGGVMWASFTLALLTLPVVIVATEEALAAVPGSMREGSYAAGASKWQTIRRIVLPRAMPGIMTGMILAMARGAGEVAPLMLVGAVKLAPELPVDGIFPFLHPERSFMHLGFHIFDLGFQSQNSEAAKPMVFTTTLLLIGIVFLLNILAVWLRGRLRRKFASAAF